MCAAMFYKMRIIFATEGTVRTLVNFWHLFGVDESLERE